MADHRRRRRPVRLLAATAGAVLIVAIVAAAVSRPDSRTRTAARSDVPTAPSSTKAPTPTAPTVTMVATTTATPSTFPPPAAALPYRLDTFAVPLVDSSRPTVSHGRQVAASRALTTLVWAPAAPGRWPLVEFAHGFDITLAPYTALLEAWAAAGFVVAAPEFPLTNPQIAGANLDENDIDNQPGDMRFVIDQLVGAGSQLAGRIDPTRVALAGHSDGAETALAESVDPAPAGQPTVRAAMAMAVSPLPGVTHTANPPLLVTQGDADTINPPSEGYQSWQEAASPKYLAILHGGGHLPPLEAGSRWLPAIIRVTLDFLGAYLAGGTAASTIAGDNGTLVSVQAG